MTESELRMLLLGQPALAALLGERVYPVTLPQGATLPAITYQVISGAGEGDGHTGPGLSRRRYQFDCWAATYGQAADLGRALVQAVHARRLLGQAALLDNEVDQYEAETQRWRRIVDVMVWT
jgi:hypothetical protein